MRLLITEETICRGANITAKPWMCVYCMYVYVCSKTGRFGRLTASRTPVPAHSSGWGSKLNHCIKYSDTVNHAIFVVDKLIFINLDRVTLAQSFEKNLEIFLLEIKQK